MSKPILAVFLLSTIFSVTKFAQTQLTIAKPSQETLKKLENDKIPPQKENEILVVGEVVNPQTIKTTEEITITQVIEMVGGLNEEAAEDILVIRKSSSSKYNTDVMINIRHIKTGKAKDLIMKDGDIIVVVKRTKFTDPLKERGYPLPRKILPKNVK